MQSMQTRESIDPVCVHPEPLVDRVRQGESAGVEELHRLLGRGVRFLAARKLRASQVDGCVHEVLGHVVRGIQRGDLDNALELAPYVRARLAAHIREIQEQQMPKMPMGDASCANSAADEHVEIMRNLLVGLSPIERESLVRFYVQGHDEPRICRELRVPAAEFRALRVRVKSRFHELCQ